MGLPLYPHRPHDISRTYDADVIRINSQSGKGGIGFLLQQNYGYNPPPHMRNSWATGSRRSATTTTGNSSRGAGGV